MQREETSVAEDFRYRDRALPLYVTDRTPRMSVSFTLLFRF